MVRRIDLRVAKSGVLMCNLVKSLMLFYGKENMYLDDLNSEIKSCVNSHELLYNFVTSYVVLKLMASPKDRGSGKNKRKWKEEEDDVSIEVLKDLVNGKHHLKPIMGLNQEKLKAKLPESNLKTQPHVHSRLQHFKGIYNVVHDMVVGSCTSGFGWNPETKSVVVEKEVWKAYVKELRKMGLSEVASILVREIRAASSNISRAIGFDVELSKKRSKLNEELANLSLTTMERHRAVRKITSEPESVDAGLQMAQLPLRSAQKLEDVDLNAAAQLLLLYSGPSLVRGPLLYFLLGLGFACDLGRSLKAHPFFPCLLSVHSPDLNLCPEIHHQKYLAQRSLCICPSRFPLSVEKENYFQKIVHP
ncbi:hypothetical protein Cgig2_021926 [Carnegiea gigantea]|uniref:Myb/SANT-like domain-containing protein n=1 Tax=Carnegiea gigantea TaxID=171969 RepID=A0A9Q1JHL0_9CARY|nr:hypothetical protein Cgig2_021926 [Carnegiea gigantea]